MVYGGELSDREGAAGVEREDGEREREKGEVQYCTVLEVLKDEAPKRVEIEEERKRGFGYREGKWCALDVGREGTGFVSVEAFEMMRGAQEKAKDKERVHGMGRGEMGGGEGTVSSVAKVWGFGGRRV